MKVFDWENCPICGGKMHRQSSIYIREWSYICENKCIEHYVVHYIADIITFFDDPQEYKISITDSYLKN